MIYDDFSDSSPDFHMLTEEELSAILPGDPIPLIFVIQAFTARSSAKYLALKPVCAQTVQLLLCPVVILLTSMAYFSFLLSATFCTGLPLNP